VQSTNFTGATGVTAKQAADEKTGTLSKSLILRIVSGTILAAVGLAAVWYGGWYFGVLAIVAGLLMAREWDRLTGGSGVNTQLAGQSAVIVGVAVLSALGAYVWALAVVGAGLLISVFAAESNRPKWSPLGVVYISLPIVALVWLRAEPANGVLTVVWLLAVVWATDCGAYVAGRMIGGPKMAPRLSPNKTWSGLGGGMIAAGLTGAAIAVSSNHGPPVWFLLGGAAMAVVGQIGDVFESAIKRYAGVKDSGAIIPGHGGVLDRLDSLLFVALFVAAANLIFGAGILWR